MSGKVTIAVVGDRDPSSVTHRATDDSLDHAAAALGLDLAHRWVPTPDLAHDARDVLAGDSGVWIAPGSPYASMAGALAAIRLAREEGVPLIGTCGGFQHMVIEFARTVLGLRVAGADAGGEARVVEIPEHPFFVATLFVPQTGSAPGRPHPLVAAFVRAAALGARRTAGQLSSAK
jgi:CTP synthase (UTP-ammonia lyase)